MSRRARGASPLSEPASAKPLCSRTLLSSGLRRCSRPVSRKLCANTSAGSSMSAVSWSSSGAVGVEGVLDGGVEELLLALEVVVERAHPDVGGLGDLQDRDVDLAGRDEGLGGAHSAARVRALRRSRRFGARLPARSSRSPLLPVSDQIQVQQTVNVEEFVRNS